MNPQSREPEFIALEAGATAVCPCAEKPWGQIVAFMRDKDGIIVELCSPPNRLQKCGDA